MTVSTLAKLVFLNYSNFSAMTMRIIAGSPYLIIQNLEMIDPNGKKDEQQLLYWEKQDLSRMEELFS